MTKMKLWVGTLSSVCVAVMSLKVAALYKFSWIVGSLTASFSGTSVVMPLVGVFGGSITPLLVGFFKYLTASSHGFQMLAYQIPGICGALYWSRPSFGCRVLLPLVCFVAFIVHPVGGYAVPYALYWFVPIVVYCVPRQSFFLHALACTFIMHAVGSVIWLYTVPMSVASWYALIPLVAVERLLCAAGMVVAYSSVMRCRKIYRGMCAEPTGEFGKACD